MLDPIIFFDIAIIIFVLYLLKRLKKVEAAITGFHAHDNKVEVTDDLIARWQSQAEIYGKETIKGQAYRKRLADIGRSFEEVR